MVGSHVGQSLRNLRAVRADRPAAVCQGRVRTGAELVDRVAALALGLLRLGLRPGDRVCLAALNSEKYLEWLLAVPCAGGIVAPLNYRWSAEEASEAVGLVGPRFFVCDETCVGWCDVFKQRHVVSDFFILISTCPRADGDFVDAELLIQSAGPKPELVLRHSPDGIALICFTSGTTGRPKGASISHDAIVIQSLAKLAVVGYSAEDVFLHSAPMCHIGGISSSLAMVMAGGCQIFLPKFQTDQLLEATHKFKATAMITVPVMVADMASSGYLSARTGDETLFPSVKTILNGAGGFPTSMLHFVTRSFPNARIMSAYGMTEACSSMTFKLIHDVGIRAETGERRGPRHLGGVCVGKPAPHVEMAIRTKGDSSGGPFVEGNVLTRGPHVMSFYWGDPQQTAGALSKDGWLDTGDIGWFDKQGEVWLLGREKDVIKTGGENVYASEVEAALVTHPAILAAAVVGIPDPRLNEAVAALVRLHQGWKWEASTLRSHGGNAAPIPSLRVEQTSASASDLDHNVVSSSSLRLHCQKLGLSRYKVPKIILMQEDAFPATPTGKVKKDAVSAVLLDKLNQAVRAASSRL